jgi:putative hydrolase of the HAD superfamily
MITTLIFDFGDVFINLDKEGAMQNALDVFKIETLSFEMIQINESYEQGFISTGTFLDFYTETFPLLSKNQIIDAWNYIIKDFPIHRLEWLQKLSKEGRYKIILLSNTNELHIEYIKQQVSYYEDFKACFNVFYLSHEIGYRKPNANIYEFVLTENNLKPNECLFVDDTQENTDAAKILGIHTWNNNPVTDDIIHLFTQKQDLF